MTYSETSAKLRTERFGMSHLSIEIGHLYADELTEERLRAEIAAAAGWAAGATAAMGRRLAHRTPRVSTCYLVDDYFHDDLPEPHTFLALLDDAADSADLRIDYLVRESACAELDTLDIASLVVGRLVAEPPPGANGARPPVSRSGWLCNGVPSPKPSQIAMGSPLRWTPPSQNSAREHSIFLDVELWSDGEAGRRWSCPMLAAVWQLLRLGVLRDQGRRIGTPKPIADVEPVEHGHTPASPGRGLPDKWADMPPIVQLNPDAAPFPAYRTLSVMSPEFIEVEHAVRLICSSVMPDPGAAEAIAASAEREHLVLPDAVVDRIGYILQAPF